MPPDMDEREGRSSVSLTRFLEDNQRLMTVLSVFVAVIVVSGQLDSAWSNVFRGVFVLLALITWLELIANYHAVAAWWRMPRHSTHPGAWMGREERVYWFGFLLVLGFALFGLYLLVTFPVTALYVVLAILHSPIHLFLLQRCMRIPALRRRSERGTAVLASVVSGALTLLLLAAVALAILTVANAIT